MTQANVLAQLGSAGVSPGFKNRIINGDMRVAQRGTAAVTADGAYPLDRFIMTNVTDGAFSASRSTTVPTGFTNSLYFTTTTADGSLSATQRCHLRQTIEGFNIADLGWGTANAKTVTLSFVVRSSLTGTFGGALSNASVNRSYPFTYTISAADTWETKSITITGDTSGTWATDNSGGINLIFGLGVGSTYSGTAGSWAGADYRSATGAVSVIGTLNATWYITGVQLEVGSTATEFEVRPYGTELALCQRYCVVISGAGTTASSSPVASGYCVGTTNFYVPYVFKVTPRTPPTGISVTNPTSFTCAFGPPSNPSAINFAGGSFEGCFMQAVITGGTGGYGGVMYMNNTNAKIEITGMEL